MSKSTMTDITFELDLCKPEFFHSIGDIVKITDIETILKQLVISYELEQTERNPLKKEKYKEIIRKYKKEDNLKGKIIKERKNKTDDGKETPFYFVDLSIPEFGMTIWLHGSYLEKTK